MKQGNFNMASQTQTSSDIIWTAAKEGDAETLRTLVAQGVDVNVRDKNGWTPLHVATQYGHAEAMRTLIAARSMQSMRKHGLLKQEQPAVTWNETLNKHYRPFKQNHIQNLETDNSPETQNVA